LIVERQ